MYKGNVVSIEAGLATIEISVSPDALREALGSAARRLTSRVSIPGFRKGKAPRAILERFVGKEALYDETIQAFAPEAYMQALRDNDLTALEDPSFDGLESADLENGEPLKFTAKVTVKPEVKLGDYTAIKLDREQREVTDADVDRMFENWRQERAEFVPVERTTVEQGDLITADLHGSVDGKEIDELSDDDVEFEVGSGFLVDGVESGLIGASLNEPKEITVKLPESHSNEDLRGRDAAFNVVVRDIKAKQLPDLDDEFARDMGGAGSIDELREKVRHSLIHRALDDSVSDLGERALDSLVTTSEVEAPKLLVDREAWRAVGRVRDRVVQQGLTWEQYLLAKSTSEQELVKEFAEGAGVSAKKRLVVEAVAKRESLLPTEEQVTYAVMMLFRSYGNPSKADLRKLASDPETRDDAAYLLTYQNVRGFIGHTCDANPETAHCDGCDNEDHGRDHEHAEGDDHGIPNEE